MIYYLYYVLIIPEEIRVGDLKQEFGGVNSYATSYSSAGFLAVGYFGDSQCKNSLMTGGIAVNQCYTHTDDGYAYKILLTKGIYLHHLKDDFVLLYLIYIYIYLLYIILICRLLWRRYCTIL